ncbi:MAG: hypothetical protein II539_08060 [Muribaculaceae bacterium]|nr:hypothetical protein [Muribaculaceae bacterium]
MEQVTLTGGTPTVASKGSAGLDSQVGNQPTTVTGAAVATGGIDAGHFIEPDIDEELFKFSSDDTPLMNLMLKAKKVSVASPEVDHYSIDEPTPMVTVAGVTGNKIQLVSADKMKVHAYDVLAVEGVEGYTYSDNSGIVHTLSGRPLQLFVTEVNDDDEFTVKAINGVKSALTDEYGDLPTSSSPVASNTNYITAGTKLVILGNSLYETQKEVDPDLVLPQPERIYLQKRGMNQIVSDYFESQRKRIPYSKSIIAEAAIRNFKTKGNRTLLISQPAKFRVKAKHTGDMQYVYQTTGVRWQVKREVEHTGKWTYEEFIALGKLFYTGEDVPNSCLVLAGKNFMENIQCIDWSKHPEVKIEVKTNKIGWKVTAITTVFGEFQFKREPTFDRLGYENCALLLGEDRLVHYQRKAESSFNEKVDGEEATRSGILVWDALALKGSCHIWVDGNGGETAGGATEFKLWTSTTAPTVAQVTDGVVYYFTNDMTLDMGGNQYAGATTWAVSAGEMWKASVDVISGHSGNYEITWSKYYGPVSAQ